MSLTPPPRAVRNNNPGNLRKGIAWQGLSANQNDPDFCVFEEAQWGFRALAIDLHTSWKRGRDTVKELITRYAPASENDTAAYIKTVSAMTGFAPDAKLNMEDFSTLCALCRAIAVHESGGWFFKPTDLISGVPIVFREFDVPV